MKANFVKHLRWLWNNIEAILFFLFFTTFAFNIRKVFLTKYSFLGGEFNEYMTPSFSWADLLIILLIIIYITKYLIRQYRNGYSSSLSQEHNVSIKSSSSLLVSRTSSFINTIFIRPCQSIIRYTKSARRETILLILFLGWMAISIIWTPAKEIALYRVLSILEVAILALLALNFARQNRHGHYLIQSALVFCGTIQALIAVSQFVLNRSLGIRFFGESILGPNLPGVAKFAIDGAKHIRAYGTFPHPNILGGFLLVPIIILSSWLMSRLRKNEDQPMFSRETIIDKIPTPVLVAILAFLLVGLFITLSRSAILALVFFGLIFGWQKWKSLNWLWRTSWLVTLALTLFLGSYLVSHFQLNFLFSDQSLQERNLYLNVARETIAIHPVVGVGIGQFVSQEYSSHPNLPGWQYQPVHNIYLLIASELGIVGLVLFLMFLLTSLYNCCEKCIISDRNKSVLRLTSYHRTLHCADSGINTGNSSEQSVLTPQTSVWGTGLTDSHLCFIIISFLFISFFDHYLWDLKAGMIIFAIPFILLLGSLSNTKYTSV